MKKASKIITVIIFIVLYAPMLLLIAASFNTGKDLTVFEGFTFAQYGELFRKRSFGPAFPDMAQPCAQSCCQHCVTSSTYL